MILAARRARRGEPHDRPPPPSADSILYRGYFLTPLREGVWIAQHTKFGLEVSAGEDGKPLTMRGRGVALQVTFDGPRRP